MAKESSGTFILLGVAAVGVYGYLNGWFSGLLGTTTTAAAAAVPTPTSTTAAAPAASVPALGSVVHTAADLAAQVAARDPYIFPDSSLIGQAPAGYVLAKDATVSETGTVDGSFYLRADVAQAVLGVINLINAAASGGTGATQQTLATLYLAPVSNLAQIKTIMSSSGLSGFGDFQRHMAARTGRYQAARFQ